jgi:hypothetical protein
VERKRKHKCMWPARVLKVMVLSFHYAQKWMWPADGEVKAWPVDGREQGEGSREHK